MSEKHELAPVSAAEALKGRLPNVRLQVFYGAGHMLHDEHPAEFNQAVLTFLERVSGRWKKGRRQRLAAGPQLPKAEMVTDIEQRYPCPAAEAASGRGDRARYRRCIRDAPTDMGVNGVITGQEQAALISAGRPLDLCARPNFIRCCCRPRCGLTPLPRCERLRGANAGLGFCYPNPCEEEGAE